MSEFVLNSTERVTAGLPALTPALRGSADYFLQHKDSQDRAFEEKETNRKKAIAPDGAMDTTNREEREGIPLHSSVIIWRLKQLNPNLWFEPSNSDQDKMGIYILDPEAEEGKRFIIGMEREWSPEFTVVLKDLRGECTGIAAGWRRVIMRLIRQRFISEPKAFKLFGPPSRDSENWHLFTT